ncbi:uncharacterized protein DS421_13g389370 [Arachis hypogaea]|nr:uncharacterized protein DS421_13g389370 [Arachis hypogaea]
MPKNDEQTLILAKVSKPVFVSLSVLATSFLFAFLALSPMRAPLPRIVPPSPPCPCLASSPRLWMLYLTILPVVLCGRCRVGSCRCRFTAALFSAVASPV